VVRADLADLLDPPGQRQRPHAPSDHYLCIVATPSIQAWKVFLPFDDDPVLSLILSKAFLLAAGAKITDPSITRQILGR